MIFDDEWYECQDCSYGTNSSKLADAHEKESGHTMEQTVVDGRGVE